MAGVSNLNYEERLELIKADKFFLGKLIDPGSIPKNVR